MSELLKNSLIWQTVAAVMVWFSKTPAARWLAALRRYWTDSATYCFFRRLLCADPAVEKTGLFRSMNRLNEKLNEGSYSSLLRGSVLYRVYAVVVGALRDSFLLGWLFSGGVTSLLLFCFAAYWPIDYLLRDVLQIAVISSVWDEAVIIIGYFWLLHRRAMEANPIRARLNGLDLMLGFYLLAGVVLMLWTFNEPTINITGFRASMQYLLVFFLVVRLIRDDRDFYRMYNIMVCVATVIALHGIYQFVVGAPIPEHWTDQAESAVRTRVYSTFSNPNIMGAYMILFAPMTIARAYETEDTAKKVLFWFCGLCMCVSCLFTMSRGAWMALAVAAVFFALLVDRRLFLIILVGAVAACFLPFVQTRITYLFTDEFAASNARGGRARRWATALTYVDRADAWVEGLGYGIYGGAVAAQNPINPAYEYMYVDNYYVKILTENGIAGLSAFIASLLGLFWNGFRSIARSTKRKKPLCVGLLAGLLGILLQSFFESIWEEPYMMALFFAVAGMMIYAGFFGGKEE